MHGVADRCLVGVDVCGRDPAGLAVVHGHCPAVALEFAMVIPAEQAQIVEVGRSAIDPAEDVMHLGPARRRVASGKAAAAVTGRECVALGCGGDAASSSVAEDAFAV